MGELSALTPTDTPFLSAIGGLAGGRRANAVVPTWTVYDLRPPAPNRQRLEGADAPQEALPRLRQVRDGRVRRAVTFAVAFC